MKNRTQELSRRKMLAAMAISSLAGMAKGSVKPAETTADFYRPTRSKLVKVNAKPEPIAIDVSKTVAIVVDMQNDFGSKGGMFDLAGIDISIIQKAVGPTAKSLSAARKAGIPIVYLKMGFHPDLSDLGALDSVTRIRGAKKMGLGKIVRAPDGTEGRILIRDTWNTEIVPDLKPETGDIVIYKTRYSGFYKTNLDNILKKARVQTPHFHRMYHKHLRGLHD